MTKLTKIMEFYQFYILPLGIAYNWVYPSAATLI